MQRSGEIECQRRSRARSVHRLRVLPMPPTFCDPLIPAAFAEKKVRRELPGVFENPNRCTTISKSKSSTRLRYCTGSTIRNVASMPNVPRFLMKRIMVRLRYRVVDQELDLDRFSLGVHAFAVLDAIVASCNSALALRSRALSWPDPSDTGGTNGSPKTSAGTLSRNGSSKAISSALGGPIAIMSEFWKTERVL